MTDYRHDLLFLLNDVARLLRTEADRRAREDGVTRAQWGILLWLEREPGLSQRALAERLEVEPITAARLIDRLEARGMVERRPDPADRRIWRMHLLPAAAPVLAEVERHRHEILARLTAGLEPEARRTVVEALMRMKDVLCAERRAEASCAPGCAPALHAVPDAPHLVPADTSRPVPGDAAHAASGDAAHAVSGDAPRAARDDAARAAAAPRRQSRKVA